MTGSATSASPATPPPVRTQLLSLGDLPSGWSIDQTSHTSSTPKCFQAAQGLSGAGTITGEANFHHGTDAFPLLHEQIVYLPNEAEQAMTSLRKMIARCGQITLTADGHALTGTVAPMALEQLETESMAYQLNLSTKGTGQKVTLGFALVAIRQLSSEMVILLYENSGTPDVANVQGLAEHAASKVASIS